MQCQVIFTASPTSFKIQSSYSGHALISKQNSIVRISGFQVSLVDRKIPEQSELHRETLFENKQVKVETNYL